MKPNKEIVQQFEALGIVKWDTNPPKEGKIKWFNTENKIIAEADYKIILSIGPGNKYTMAYDISVYETIGIPFVEKLDEEPSVVDNVANDDAIWSRAEKVATKANAEFVYKCHTLLVAVFGFKKV